MTAARPLRLSLLLGSLSVGGAERQFLLLARGLAARGHQVRFLTLAPGGALAGEIDGHPGVEHRALLRSGERGWRAMLTLPGRLRRTLAEHPVDVLYSALYLTNALAARAGRRAGIPVVWGVRNTHVHAGWKAAAAFRLGRLQRRAVALTISNSQAGLDWHRRAGYCSPRAMVIPNGIDTDRFAPDAARRADFRRRLGVGEDDFLVGIVGRFTPAKNHGLFLHAAALAAARAPLLRFVCVLPEVGVLPPALAEAAAGLGPRLDWEAAGGAPERLYPGLDLLCLPSSAEGFPNVVGEAMACQVPCLVSGAGDSAVLVRGSGEHVTAGVPEAWAEAMLALAADPAAARARGVGARERILRDYPAARLVERTEEVLAELCAEAADG